MGHAFKSEMVSDTIWVGVLTVLNDQNGIFYLKISFFPKHLPIFTTVKVLIFADLILARSGDRHPSFLLAGLHVWCLVFTLLLPT